MKLTILTALTALLLLAVIFELLRRRQLREKYAALWMAVGLIVGVLGFFPRLLDSFARKVGVDSGVSLVLFLGIVFLLMVCIHLSWEVSRLEDKARTLAEEVALIRTELTQLTGFAGRSELQSASGSRGALNSRRPPSSSGARNERSVLSAPNGSLRSDQRQERADHRPGLERG